MTLGAQCADNVNFLRPAVHFEHISDKFYFFSSVNSTIVIHSCIDHLSMLHINNKIWKDKISYIVIKIDIYLQNIRMAILAQTGLKVRLQKINFW